MKKGFTMIEILAVFTVTAIILLIVIPQVTNLLKGGDNTARESFENDVFIAAEAYIEDDKLVVTKDCNNPTAIVFKDLIEFGYLKSNLIDPDTKKKTKEELSKKVYVCKDAEGVLQYYMEKEEYKRVIKK